MRNIHTQKWYLEHGVFLWVLPTRLTLVFSLFVIKSAVSVQPPLTVSGAAARAAATSADIDTRSGSKIR